MRLNCRQAGVFAERDCVCKTGRSNVTGGMFRAALVGKVLRLVSDTAALRSGSRKSDRVRSNSGGQGTARPTHPQCPKPCSLQRNVEGVTFNL